jgi:hypothetical protein
MFELLSFGFQVMIFWKAFVCEWYDGDGADDDDDHHHQIDLLFHKLLVSLAEDKPFLK